MLDTSPPPEPCAPADWRDRLAPGDIVMFQAPAAGQPASARLQPFLVLDIAPVHGRRCAVLAHGWPARPAPGPGRRITLERRCDWRAAGLARATRFCVSTPLIVPLAHDGFAVPTGGTPVIGQLPEAARARLQAERARLHALRDIGAERALSQRQTVRGALRGRDFAVERRNIRRPLPLAPRAAGR